MASATMEHVLPEVRPLVTNMPDTTYEVQTDGSARFRDLPITINNHYFVSGVPGHTHNASAIVGITGVFDKLRTADIIPHVQWYGHGDAAEEKLQVGEYDDAERLDQGSQQYDRAVEKAVGRIRLVPENCHQQISEPTRAISEVRTIVTAEDQLDSMTYTEEQGYFADDRTGLRIADADIHGTVYVDILGYSAFEFAGVDRIGGTTITRHNAGGAIINNRYVITGPGTVIRDNGVTVSRPFDGSLRFRFVDDGGKNQYYRADTITVRMPCILVVTIDNNLGHDVVGDPYEIDVTFGANDGVTTSKSTYGTNNYFIGTAAGDPPAYAALFHDVALAPVGGPKLKVSVANPPVGWAAADAHNFCGIPMTRIPAGRQYPFYGPPRRITGAGDGHVGYNDGGAAPGTCLRDVLMFVNPYARLLLDDRNMNPAHYMQDVGALGAFANGGGLDINRFTTGGGEAVYVGANDGDGTGYPFRAQGPQKRTIDTTHSLYKYDMTEQLRTSLYNLVTVEQRRLLGTAAATHSIVDADAIDLTTDIAVTWPLTTPPAQGDLDDRMRHFADPTEQSDKNYRLLQLEKPRGQGNSVTLEVRNPVPIGDIWTIDEARGIYAKIEDAHQHGGAISLVPCNLDFIHDHLVVLPVIATLAQKALLTPFLPTDAEIAAGGANQATLAHFYQFGQILRADLDAHGGSGLAVPVGSRLLFFDANRNRVAFVAGIAANSTHTLVLNGTLTVDALWNTNCAAAQQVAGGARAAVAVFSALGDVASVVAPANEHEVGSVTTAIDFTHIRSILSSTCNVAYRAQPFVGQVLQNYINTTAPVQVVQRVRPAPVHIPVPVLGGAIPLGGYQDWGVPADLADAANAGAQALMYRDAKSGFGDQFEVDRANFSFVDGYLALKGYALTTSPQLSSGNVRYANIFFGDIGSAAGAQYSTIVRVDLSRAQLRCIQRAGANAGNETHLFDMYTLFTDPIWGDIENLVAIIPFTEIHFNAIDGFSPTSMVNGGNLHNRVLIQVETIDTVNHRGQGLDPYNLSYRGFAYRGRQRVTQPLCAPILNPDVRIGCYPPLNFGTRHLPPEMRDFRLELKDVDFSFLPTPTDGTWTFDPLKVYQFAGGNQVATAQDALLYLPEFKHFEFTADTNFTETVYSSNGLPSYFVVFCRNTAIDIANNYSRKQPMIESLNIRCDTTKRRSNVICDDMDKSYLYHMTMRNVHPRSRYNSTRYNMRQVVLLAAEDIGIMGLQTDDYQRVRRVRFEFSGTTNGPGKLHILLVYNNRALEVYGADLKVVHL